MAKYNRHTNAFKIKAIKLATEIGVAGAAKQLNISPNSIYIWKKTPSKINSQEEIQRLESAILDNTYTGDFITAKAPSLSPTAQEYEIMRLRTINEALTNLIKAIL